MRKSWQKAATDVEFDEEGEPRLYKGLPDPIGFTCSLCGQMFDTNPEDPPFPHLEKESDEICVSWRQWHKWELEDETYQAMYPKKDPSILD